MAGNFSICFFYLDPEAHRQNEENSIIIENSLPENKSVYNVF